MPDADAERRNRWFLDLLAATEFVAIVTGGDDGPHVVGTWREGQIVEDVKKHFPWARGALVITIESIALQL